MSLLKAVGEVAQFLEEQGIPYVVLGGMAVQYWGEPRATRDVDVAVMVPFEALEVFIDRVLEHFHPRLPDARAFALRHRILLVATEEGVPVDISLGIPGYEEEVMRRAVIVSFADMGSIRLISAEDLIIHKCVASRPRDLEDVERILIRQRLNLNVRYIRLWLKEFAQILEHNPLSLFEKAVKTVRRVLPRKDED